MSYRTGNFPVTADGTVAGRVTVARNGLLFVFDCTCDYKTNDILRLAAVCHGKYVPLGVTVPEAGILRLKKSFTKNALMSVGYDDAASFRLIRPGDLYPEQVSDETDLEAPIDETADSVPESAVPAAQPEAAEQIVYNDFPDPEAYDYNYSDDGEPEPEAQAGVPEPSDSPVPESAGAPPETADGWMSLPNPGILFDDQSIGEACQGITNALITERDGFVLLAIPVLPTEPFPLMPVFCFGSSGQVGGQDCIIFKIKDGNMIL
jgi:hypothetical protein